MSNKTFVICSQCMFILFILEQNLQGRAQGGGGGGGGDGGGRRPLFEILTYNFLLKIAFDSEKIVL